MLLYYVSTLRHERCAGAGAGGSAGVGDGWSEGSGVDEGEAAGAGKRDERAAFCSTVQYSEILKIADVREKERDGVV